MRYRLKQKYFNGVPANEIRTTSPVASMTDEQWRALVARSYQTERKGEADTLLLRLRFIHYQPKKCSELGDKHIQLSW